MADATERLTAIGVEPWNTRLSFYYRSAYDFPPEPSGGRGRDTLVCEDLKDECGEVPGR